MPVSGGGSVCEARVGRPWLTPRSREELLYLPEGERTTRGRRVTRDLGPWMVISLTGEGPVLRLVGPLAVDPCLTRVRVGPSPPRTHSGSGVLRGSGHSSVSWSSPSSPFVHLNVDHTSHPGLLGGGGLLTRGLSGSWVGFCPSWRTTRATTTAFSGGTTSTGGPTGPREPGRGRIRPGRRSQPPPPPPIPGTTTRPTSRSPTSVIRSRSTDDGPTDAERAGRDREPS